MGMESPQEKRSLEEDAEILMDVIRGIEFKIKALEADLVNEKECANYFSVKLKSVEGSMYAGMVREERKQAIKLAEEKIRDYVSSLDLSGLNLDGLKKALDNIKSKI